MTDLLDKDFKTIAFKLLQELKDDVEKVQKMICKQKRNINEKIEKLKTNQNKILEFKNLTTEMKNSVEGFSE